MSNIVLRMVGVLLATTPFLLCQTEGETKSLRGIETINVNVTVDGEVPGFPADAVKTDTELALRQNGITVVKSISDGSNVESHASLFMGVRFHDQKTGAYAVYASAAVMQMVSIPRTKETLALITWSSDILGTVGKSHVGDLRDALKDLTSRVLNAYLSVNPKR